MLAVSFFWSVLARPTRIFLFFGRSSLDRREFFYFLVKSKNEKMMDEMKDNLIKWDRPKKMIPKPPRGLLV